MKGKKAEVIRWNQVESFRRQTTKLYVLFFHVLTRHTYIVRRVDGKKFNFSDMYNHIEALGNGIDQMVMQYQAPQAIAAYNAGSIIPFNFNSQKMSIGSQGIYRGQKLIPWNEIKLVQIKHIRYGGNSAAAILLAKYIGPYSSDFLVIERQGQGLFSKGTIKVGLSRVSNVSVFMTLVRYASHGMLGTL